MVKTERVANGEFATLSVLYGSNILLIFVDKRG